jgi:O-antigen ligase
MSEPATAYSLIRKALAVIFDCAGVVLLAWLMFEVIFGSLDQPFEMEGLWVAVIGVAAWLVRPGTIKRVPLPMVAYTGVALISAAAHQWARVSTVPDAKWWQLFEPAFYLLIMCALILGAAHLLRTPLRLALFVVFMAASIHVVAVQLMFDRVSTNFLDPRVAMGFQYQPSVMQWGGLHQTGLLLVLGLPLVTSLAVSGSSLWLTAAGLILGCGLLFAGYVNGSRSGVFSMVIVALSMAAIPIFTGRARRRLLIVGVFAVVPLVLVAAVLSGKTTMPAITSWSGGRGPIWEAAWSMFRDHPWLGVGPGNFTLAMTAGGYAAAHLPWYPAQSSGVEQAHNLLLQVAAETGVFGALSVIALWVWLLAASWRAWKHGPAPLVAIGLFFAFAGFVMRTMSDNFLDGLGTTPRTRVLIWLLMGAALALHRLTPTPVRASP